MVGLPSKNSGPTGWPRTGRMDINPALTLSESLSPGPALAFGAADNRKAPKAKF